MIARSFWKFLLIGGAMTLGSHAEGAGEVLPSLAPYLRDRAGEFDVIPAKRKAELNELAEFIAARREDKAPVRLTFVCTHNSRRSQMAQIWAAAAAAHLGIANVEAYSAGTEATAFNPRAVAAMKRSGVPIEPAPLPGAAAPSNPRYAVRLTQDGKPLECFSKTIHERPNPSGDFCAVMVCSDADEACPRVAGAAKRISLPYDDPKAADDSPEEAQRYDERCAQIAREMLYMFTEAAKR